MNRLVGILVAGVCFLMLASDGIIAETLHVPSDVKDIQAAIDSAQDGDTILVAPGKYRGNYVIADKSVYLSSTEGMQETLIRGRTTKYPVITLTGNLESPAVVRGFTLENKSRHPAIRCDDCNAEVLYCRISHSKSRDMVAAAVHAKGPQSRMRLIGNIFDLNQVSALRVDSVRTIIADSNAFISNIAPLGAAIRVARADTVSASWNLIYRNSAQLCGTLLLEDVRTLLLDHNTIYANASGECATVDLRDCGIAVITNCIIGYDLASYGVRWGRGDHIAVHHNDLWGNAVGACLGVTDANENIADDPIMCNTLEFDFTLAANSPCAGAGENRTDIGAQPVGCEGFPTPDDYVLVDEMPVEIHHEFPNYPYQAEDRGVSGTVWVQCLVDKEGRVRQAKILRGSGANVGFERAAIEVAYKNRYRPAKFDGQPVACWVVYKVEFVFRH